MRIKDVGINSVVRKGIDYKEIVKYSKEKKIDLIVITIPAKLLIQILLGTRLKKG